MRFGRTMQVFCDFIMKKLVIGLVNHAVRVDTKFILLWRTLKWSDFVSMFQALGTINIKYIYGKMHAPVLKVTQVRFETIPNRLVTCAKYETETFASSSLSLSDYVTNWTI